MSWWFVVLQVIAIAFASLAWGRELRKRHDNRTKAATQSATAKSASPADAEMPSRLSPGYPLGVGNPDDVYRLRVVRQWGSGYGALANRLVTTAPLEVVLASHVSALESRVADLEQRLQNVEGQLAGLGQNARNVAAKPARANEPQIRALLPIQAT